MVTIASTTPRTSTGSSLSAACATTPASRSPDRTAARRRRRPRAQPRALSPDRRPRRAPRALLESRARTAHHRDPRDQGRPPIYQEARTRTRDPRPPRRRLKQSPSPPRTASLSFPMPDVSTERDADLLFVCAGGNPATFNDKATFACCVAWHDAASRWAAYPAGPIFSPVPDFSTAIGRRCIGSISQLSAKTFPTSGAPSLFEIDGNRITCSGGISALDMMVALIERDHGHELAAAVGDWFLHTHIREGMGPQRMDLRFRLGVTDEKLLRVLRQMETSIETPQSREDLARIAGVSVRQLERLFRRQLGRGIHAHYSSMRLERARQLLRETTLPILDVALATGSPPRPVCACLWPRLRQRRPAAPALAPSNRASSSVPNRLDGSHIHPSAYLKLKHADWNEYGSHLTDWERKTTLDC